MNCYSIVSKTDNITESETDIPEDIDILSVDVDDIDASDDDDED